MRTFILLLFVLLSACAQPNKKTGVKQQRQTQAERIFRAREQALQDKKDKDRLLTQKYKFDGQSDEVLYQQGMRELNDRSYGPALKNFNQILTDFPNSSRRASALYNKALVLQRMNLNEQAEQIFKKIQRLYPGSLEARTALQLQKNKVHK